MDFQEVVILKQFDNCTNFWYFWKKDTMNKNTSISIGDYFDDFIKSSISAGRYKNASEVVRAGLRLLEEEENKVIALRGAIKEGLESGSASDYNPKSHLANLKNNKGSNV